MTHSFFQHLKLKMKVHLTDSFKFYCAGTERQNRNFLTVQTFPDLMVKCKLKPCDNTYLPWQLTEQLKIRLSK